MTQRKLETAPVSERALIQRINRKLAVDGEKLHRSREGSARMKLGEWFIVEESTGITAYHCDLEDLGRELGVLQEWETLCADGTPEIVMIDDRLGYVRGNVMWLSKAASDALEYNRPLLNAEQREDLIALGLKCRDGIERTPDEQARLRFYCI